MFKKKKNPSLNAAPSSFPDKLLQSIIPTCSLDFLISWLLLNSLQSDLPPQSNLRKHLLQRLPIIHLSNSVGTLCTYITCSLFCIWHCWSSPFLDIFFSGFRHITLSALLVLSGSLSSITLLWGIFFQMLPKILCLFLFGHSTHFTLKASGVTYMLLTLELFLSFRPQ